jgi:hypothetical protein
MDYDPILIDESSGEYKYIILIHFFAVSIVAIILNLIALAIIIRKLSKGANVDMQISTMMILIDLGAAIGTFIRAIICQSPYNLLAYDKYWCRFDALFTTQLLIFSGVTIGILSFERFLLVCFNKRISVWIWVCLIFFLCSAQWSLFALNVINDRQRLVSIAVYCTVGVVEGAQLMRTIFLFNLISSYLLVMISYIGIMIFRYRQCLNQLKLNIPKELVYKECLNTVSKSLTNIFLVMLVYSGKIICVVYEVITGEMRTWLMDYIATICIACSLILNISILLYMNSSIRKSFFVLITTGKFDDSEERNIRFNRNVNRLSTTIAYY